MNVMTALILARVRARFAEQRCVEECDTGFSEDYRPHD